MDIQPISEESNLDPQTYFDRLKESKKHNNSQYLEDLKANSEILLQKAHALGQDTAVKKLLFTLSVLESEQKLLEIGIDTFVYRDDIEYFISDVKDKAIKIIELKNYPREIPTDIAETVIKLKETKTFDEYFIVFTDYTGEVERAVAQEDKRKDPILFGVFLDKNNIHDRFYYIADWEDEYCDLTLSKMINHMAEVGKKIDMPVGISNVSIKEIKAYSDSLEAIKDSQIFRVRTRPKNLFSKIRTFFTGK